MTYIIFSMTLFVTCVISSVAYEINKCCPEGQMYGVIENKPACVNENYNYYKYDWLPTSVNETIKNKLKINFGDAQCSDNEEWSARFDLNFKENSVFLKDEITYKHSSFCLERLAYDKIELLIARECPCLEHVCIPKCCDKGEHLNDTNHCINSENATDWRFEMLNETIFGKHHVVHRFPDCISKNKVSKYVQKYKLNSDGSLFLNVETIIAHDEYCGDYKERDDGVRDETIIACFDKIIISTESIIYGVSSVIGAIFFLTTALILFWIPELGGSPKWSMAIHVSCFFVADASLAYQQLSPSLFGLVFCKIIAYVMQFSFVASIFWLNVMCINMSLIFRNLKGAKKNYFTEHRKFVIFSLYAWLGSLLITLATVVAEYSPILDEYSLLKPNFGVVKCWFTTNEAIWLYFFGPIGILLSFNLGLFIYATYKLFKYRQELKISENEDDKKKNINKSKRRFLFLLKLMFLMGIPWITEIISWVCDDKDSAWHFVWYITDALNMMRAVFVFIIVCCNKKARRKINKKAPWIGQAKNFITNLLCRKKSTCDQNIEHTCGSNTFSESRDSVINDICMEQIVN